VEALAVLKANGDINLVVTDINMPRMDGYAAAEAAGKRRQHHTVIVSAYGDMTTIRTAMNRGALIS
jgi:YesN/AraC family two-component response regulator